MQERNVVVRGLPTGFLTSPGEADRPVLLFFHGYPDTPWIFEDQFSQFMDHFYVIAPFMRGVGPSIGGTEDNRFSLDSIALDILGILQRLNVKNQPVYLVCHDLGVPQALPVAPLLGGRLKGLVVMAGLSIGMMVHRLRMPKQHIKSWYIYLMQVPGLAESLLRRRPRNWLDLAYTLGGLDRERRPTNAGSGLSPAFKHYRSYVQASLRKAIRHPKAIDVPSLVVWGKKDGFLLPPTIDELERELTNVEVRILPGGHWLFREHPEEVNGLILDFVERIHRGLKAS